MPLLTRLVSLGGGAATPTRHVVYFVLPIEGLLPTARNSSATSVYRVGPPSRLPSLPLHSPFPHLVRVSPHVSPIYVKLTTMLLNKVDKHPLTFLGSHLHKFYYSLLRANILSFPSQNGVHQSVFPDLHTTSLNLQNGLPSTSTDPQQWCTFISVRSKCYAAQNRVSNKLQTPQASHPTYKCLLHKRAINRWMPPPETPDTLMKLRLPDYCQ
jgi:hypothetical protein